MYPLEIASVTLAVESSEQPWTRVSESENGNSSEWQTGDAITVSLNGETATYTYNGSTWTSTAPLYWQNTQTATVTAWYASPDTDGTIDLSDQSEGLAYVLKDTGEGNYQSDVSLTFTHQLAKVRVKANGVEGYPVTVNSVKIKSYTKCAHTNGDNLTGSGEDWITMQKTTYNGDTYWEANVVPGQPITKFQLNDKEGTLNDNGINPVAGAVNTITIDVQQKVTEIDLSTYEDATLTVSGKTIIKGDSTEKELQIIVEQGADVTLQGINLAYTGQAVIICKGDATLTFSGTNTLSGTPVEFKYSSGSGIYIEQGTLTINAVSGASLSISRTKPDGLGLISGMGICVGENANLVIKNGNISIGNAANEGDDSGPGIGNLYNCGNITIEGGNISVGKVSWYAAGIGSVASGNCKNITITGENTVVNVQKGTYATYYIGPGMRGTATGTITIGGGATVNGTKYTETHTGPL